MMAAAYAQFSLMAITADLVELIYLATSSTRIFFGLFTHSLIILLFLAPYLSASPWSHPSISYLLQAFKQGISYDT